jgi:hypothetical protein
MRVHRSAFLVAVLLVCLLPAMSVDAAPWPEDGGRVRPMPVRGGPDGGPGGFRDRERDFGRGDFGRGDFDRDRRGGFRPPPPPPPLPPPRFDRAERFPPPPPYFSGNGGIGGEGADGASDDPNNFIPPSWLKEWIAAARARGYDDNELAVILSRHPRLERFIRRSRDRGFSDQTIFAAMGLAYGAPQPSHASVAPLPLPEAKPAAPKPSSSSLQLEVPESLHITETEVELSGKVKAAPKGTTVFVDGAQVSLGKDGSFSYRRGVPIGETEIKVEARDAKGRGTDAMVTVTREPPAVTLGAYEPLNPARAKGKKNSKAVALIIGIDRYESAPRAEFAENDANAFYDYATRALGVPGDRVKLLTGSKARRLSVEKAVLAWVQPLVAQGASDVYLFFSGHGLASDDGRDQYLLPYDGDRVLLAQSALRRKDLIESMVAAGARSVTLFLDTCYSGGTRGNEMLVQAARPILISVKEGDLPPNVTILAASGRDQLSSSLSGAKHGLFSYYLMKGLEGEAANGGRSITTGALENYLQRQVPGEAAKLGRSQVPELSGDSDRVLSQW